MALAAGLVSGCATRAHDDLEARIALERERLYASLDAVETPAAVDTPETLTPGSSAPLSLRFTDASLQDILDIIGEAAGINILYDPEFQDRTYSIELDGVTVEEALDLVLTANQHFYKVLSPRVISAAPR